MRSHHKIVGDLKTILTLLDEAEEPLAALRVVEAIDILMALKVDDTGANKLGLRNQN